MKKLKWKKCQNIFDLDIEWYYIIIIRLWIFMNLMGDVFKRESVQRNM